MIKKVGDTEILPRHKASCHCGSVVMMLTLPNGIVDPRRCSCSYCRRRGAITATTYQEDINILKGEDKLGLYQFNTGTAEHYYCSKCGIYTHHKRRSSPDQYGYNVANLEGVNPFLLGEVPTFDGINHPSDREK